MGICICRYVSTQGNLYMQVCVPMEICMCRCVYGPVCAHRICECVCMHMRICVLMCVHVYCGISPDLLSEPQLFSISTIFYSSLSLGICTSVSLSVCLCFLQFLQVLFFFFLCVATSVPFLSLSLFRSCSLSLACSLAHSRSRSLSVSVPLSGSLSISASLRFPLFLSQDLGACINISLPTLPLSLSFLVLNVLSTSSQPTSRSASLWSPHLCLLSVPHLCLQPVSVLSDSPFPGQGQRIWARLAPSISPAPLPSQP